MFYDMPTTPLPPPAEREGVPFFPLLSACSRPYSAALEEDGYSPVVTADRCAYDQRKDSMSLLEGPSTASFASTASTACDHCASEETDDNGEPVPCWSCMAEMLLFSRANSLEDGDTDSETDIGTVSSIAEAPQELAGSALLACAEGPPIVGQLPASWPSPKAGSQTSPLAIGSPKSVRFRGFVEVVLTHHKDDYKRSMLAPDFEDGESHAAAEHDENEPCSESHEEVGAATPEMELHDSSAFGRQGLKPNSSPKAGFALTYALPEPGSSPRPAALDFIFASYYQQPMF